MMARKRKRRSRGVTIAVMVGSHETRHRGRTLKQALAVAKRQRLAPGCVFRWHSGSPRLKHARPGGLYRLPGRVAGADGHVECGGRDTGRSAYLLVYRPHAKSGRTGSGKAYRKR